MAGFSRYGIDELYKLHEAADRAGDTKMIEAIQEELDTRDIEGSNQVTFQKVQSLASPELVSTPGLCSLAQE